MDYAAHVRSILPSKSALVHGAAPMSRSIMLVIGMGIINQPLDGGAQCGIIDVTQPKEVSRGTLRLRRQARRPAPSPCLEPASPGGARSRLHAGQSLLRPRGPRAGQVRDAAQRVCRPSSGAPCGRASSASRDRPSTRRGRRSSAPGCPACCPGEEGPERAHKLSARSCPPSSTGSSTRAGRPAEHGGTQRADPDERFGVSVHPRSIQRALLRLYKKKPP